MEEPSKNKIIISNDHEESKDKRKFSLIQVCNELRKDWVKYVYTLLLLGNYVASGNSSHLLSEAMVDLKFMLKTDMVKLNYGTSIGAVGVLFGCLSTFSYKYLNRQLTLSVMGIILSIFLALEPLSQSLWHFYLLSFLLMIGSGGLIAGSPAWVIEIWGKRASTVLHLQQLSYGIGSIIGPFIVGPYLVGDISNKTTDATIDYMTTTLSPMNSTEVDINYKVDRRAKLIIPYVISGIIQIIVPILMLVMFVVKRYEKAETNSSDSQEKTERPDTRTRLKTRTRILLIVLFSLSMTAYQALELTFVIFGPTYFQYIPIHISATKAAKMTSYMSITYTIGRGVSALISSKVKASIMLSYHIVILGVALVLLYFAQQNETILYVAMVVIGFGYSAMQPSYYSFADNTMKMTDSIGGIFTMSAVTFLIISPFIIAPSIEKHPEIVLYLLFGSFTAVVILFIMILLIVRMSNKQTAQCTEIQSE